MNLKLLATSVGLLFLMSCSATQKDYSYMKSNTYKNREVLTSSLVSEQGELSEEAIENILNGKIKLPKKVNVAVIRLSNTSYGLNFQLIDKDLAEKLYKKDVWGNRVQSVIPMPELLRPKKVTVSSLRKSAALLQADALVVVKPISYSDWKFQWFEEDKAIGITTLEVIVIDTRTMIVPFTQIITERVEILKTDKELNNYELISKAKRESEKKAMLKVAPAVGKFISEVM